MSKLKNIFQSGLLLFLIFFTIASFAYPFIIVPKAGTTLPTALFAGITAPAYYTVTNNTLEQRRNNFVEYLPPNVTQVSAGGTFSDTCGSSFTLAPFGHAGSSCTLQLLVSGPVDASDPDPTHHLFVCFPGKKVCAGTNFPLNVEQENSIASLSITPVTASIPDNGSQQYTAIATFSDGSTTDVTDSATWTSSNPTAATISQTGLASGVTGDQSTSIQASFTGVESNLATLNVEKRLVSIAVTPTTQQMRVAYSNQFTATGTYDDSSTGNITTSVTWVSSTPATATINASGLATGVALGSTNISASLGTINSNTAVATVVRFTYLLSVGIDYCLLSSSGVISGCNTATASLSSGLAVNSAGTFLIGFTGSSSGSVVHCPVNADGSVTSNTCTTSSVQPGSTLSGSGIAINPVVSVAYIPGTNSSLLYSCTLNSTTGNTTGCQSPSSLGRPSFPAVTPNGQVLYLVDESSGTDVYYCTLNPDGSVNICNSAGVTPGGSQPIEGLAVSGSNLYVYYSTTATTCFIQPCTIDQTSSNPTPSCNTGDSVSVACTGGPRNLAIDPSGTILYASDNGAHLETCTANGTSITGCGQTSPIGTSIIQMTIR